MSNPNDIDETLQDLRDFRYWGEINDLTHVSVHGGPTLLRTPQRSIVARADRLGKPRPHGSARCTCKEGYSNWHMLAAGLLDSDGIEDFLNKAREAPGEVLTADMWEHTWEGENFELFRSLFFCENTKGLSEDQQKEILLGRTPAELAYLARREFPTCGEDRKPIPACVCVQRWVEILRRTEAQAFGLCPMNTA